MTLISGQVIDHTGAGVAGVWVYAYPADGARFGRSPGTHTDIAGRWSFDLPPGRWLVRETGHDTYEFTVTATEPQPEGPASFAVGDVVRRRHSGHLGTITALSDTRLSVEFKRASGDTFTAEVPLEKAGEALAVVTPAEGTSDAR